MCLKWFVIELSNRQSYSKQVEMSLEYALETVVRYYLGHTRLNLGIPDKVADMVNRLKIQLITKTSLQTRNNLQHRAGGYSPFYCKSLIFLK